MISVVEHIHQVSIERVDVVKFWELINDGAEFLVDRCLHVLHFSHVKLSDSGNFESGSNHGWCFPLSFTQRNINQLVSVWDLGDSLEIVAH